MCWMCDVGAVEWCPNDCGGFATGGCYCSQELLESQGRWPPRGPVCSDCNEEQPLDAAMCVLNFGSRNARQVCTECAEKRESGGL